MRSFKSGVRAKGKLAAGHFSLLVGLLASSMATAQICSTDANLAIPDGSGSATPGAPASISITVPAFYTNAITDLDFDLQINHTWVGDLTATLTSPAGTTVTLMNRPGTPPGTFGCNRNDIDTTLDDSAANAIENECAGATPTIAGTLSPNGALSAFNTEIPAGTWTLTVTDNARFDLGTIISAGNCLSLTTVPVVLSSFKTRQRGNRVFTKWQTASEAFNLGFNLWGKIDDEWTQLNHRLIRSKNIDSIEPETYGRVIAINDFSSPPTAYGISSLDTSGTEEFYGPFELNEDYGETTIPKPIDWKEEQEKFAQSMLAAGYERRNGIWRQPSERGRQFAKNLANRFSDAWLTVKEPGLYKVTYEELLAKGINLRGLQVKRLALSHAGYPIGRWIKGSDSNPKRFGPGAYIVFVNKKPDGKYLRYNDITTIRLSADLSKTLKAPSLAGLNLSDTESGHKIESIQMGSPKGHSFIIPGDLPWYDDIIYAFGSTGSKKFNFDVKPDADLKATSSTVLKLMGGTSFENVDVDGDGELEPDHHFKVYLNREQYPEAIFESYSEKVDEVLIEADLKGQLVLGSNTLELEVIPDNGHNIDAAYFLSGSIEYRRSTNGINSEDQIAIDDHAHRITLNDTSATAAFLFDESGNLMRLLGNSDSEDFKVDVPKNISKYQRYLQLQSESANYQTITDAATATSLAAETLSLDGVEYVIVAHPALINSKLKEFSEFHTNNGRVAKIVSTSDIYAKYSEGIAHPFAIKNYLKEQYTEYANSLKYVLLVGGHTFNYRGFNVAEEIAPISFVPSFYRSGEETINRQIPTAVPFVDFDEDNAPDIAIGRWPVRDSDQLAKVVDKTLAWHSQGSNKDTRSALFIAQQDEALNNFSGALERIETNLGYEGAEWVNIDKIYLSELIQDPEVQSNQLIQVARERIAASMNSGPALTVFSGHGSPTSWGRENLINTSTVDQFTNNDRPSLIFPLACYTTYYETPNVKSLAESLFTDNSAGAVGLSGPALISYGSENTRFAKNLVRHMSQEGMDLGSAVLKAKNDLKNSGPRKQTVIYNWVTLADPTLTFGLPAKPVITETEAPNKGE